MVDLGVNELFEGVTVTHGMHKYVLPPSSFAEAEIGLMTESQIRRGLDEVIKQAQQNAGVAPAIRRALKRYDGQISLEDVIERVKAHHEKRGKLITKKAVGQAAISGGGVFSYEIERRGDSRAERNRIVTIELDGTGNIVQYSCPCPTYMKNFVKGNFDSTMGQKEHDRVKGQLTGKEISGNGGPKLPRVPAKALVDVSGFKMFTTNVGCYHVAVALLHISKVTGLYTPPFSFTNSQIYNALFMDVFWNRKEATIDDYLFGSGVVTQETTDKVMRGEGTIEVIKHSTNLETAAMRILKNIRQVREKDGYVFNGFATVARQTRYQNTAVVLTKPDGRSVYLLYDVVLGVGPKDERIALPFLMLNSPTFLWQHDLGRQLPSERMLSDPLAIIGTPLIRFDERTQQDVVSIVAKPDAIALAREENVAYDRIVTERRAVAAAR